MDSGGNRPMNMATHGTSGGGSASDHPPQYMSPPPTSAPHLYLPPPSHLSAPPSHSSTSATSVAAAASAAAAYPPSAAAAASAVGVQEILNLAAASSRERPAFPGLQPGHIQAVVQQHQQAHQIAVQAAQQTGVHQPMELDLRGQNHVQHVQRSSTTPLAHHQQMQQHIRPQQLAAKLNIKTESYEINQGEDATSAHQWEQQVQQQQLHRGPSSQRQQMVQQQHTQQPQVPPPRPLTEFELMQAKINSMNPMDVWNLVRMKILPCFTPWDYMCDRTRIMGTRFSDEVGEAKLPTGVSKLKFLLQEMNDLAEELSLLVEGCCETIEEEVMEDVVKEDDAKENIENEKETKPETNGDQKPTLPPNPEAAVDTTGESAKDDTQKEVAEEASKIEEEVKVIPAATNPYQVVVEKAVRTMLGNEKLSKLKPKEISEMAVQYQSLFDEYDGPPLNIKMETEALEIECNPYSYNSAMKKRVMKIKSRERRPRGPPYRCGVCTKTFPNRNRYNYHQKKSGACPGIPVDPKPHKYVGNRYYCIHKDCLPDGQEINVDVHPQYTNRTQYWKHFAEAHGATVEHTYTCNYCAEVFPLKEMHDYHVKNKHERSHTCGYCGNRFSERRTLVKHERCHTGEKPYACDSCDFRCSSSSSLCQHKRRRHDPAETGRKHICEQCGKGFYTRDNLKEHIATHSNTKMFSCYICGKGLKNDSCYRRHMVCVHGLKHTCDLCGKDFSSPVGLKHHRRGAHGILF